jgi:dihydrofolate reductase
MGKLVVVEFVTLDGVMQSPTDPNEDRSGGFDKGGWQRPYFDDVLGEAMVRSQQEAGAFLFGRRTYENFAAYWPNQPAGAPLAEKFNALPKYVVSTTLADPLPWQNSSLISPDVGQELGRLKLELDGDIHLIGSGELVRTVMREDLVDEYRLMVHPIVLGEGKRLFRDGDPLTRVQLTASASTSTGVLLVTYSRAS